MTTETEMNVTYQNGWAVPAGWKLVPVKPTVEMVEHGAREVSWYEHNARHCYEAMLAAAPEPAGESCRTINIEDINIDDIVAWADGVQGALGTECADRVTEMEAAASRAVMTAIASAPDRCPHGVRRPHECKECADTIPASEALDWAEREFAAARQSPGEPVQVETTVKESLMTEQPAPDVTALVEALERSVAGFVALSGMTSLGAGARDYARQKAIELNASLAAYRKQQEPSHDNQ